MHYIKQLYSANYFVANAVYRILHHYMEDLLIWEIVDNHIIYYIMYYNIMEFIIILYNTMH